jgi:retron-type reverse transcriptase
MLEEILDYRNIQRALRQVMSNKGAGGIDGMSTGELPEWLERHWKEWKESIGEGRYRPAAVRKVEIPKAGEESECSGYHVSKTGCFNRRSING